MTVGERIRSARERRGWSLREFARLVGLDRRTVRRYESDEQGQRLKTAQKLAQVLGVSVNYLAGDATEATSGLERRVGALASGDREIVLRVVDQFVRGGEQATALREQLEVPRVETPAEPLFYLVDDRQVAAREEKA